jgi:hypothetical protein
MQNATRNRRAMDAIPVAKAPIPMGACSQNTVSHDGSGRVNRADAASSGTTTAINFMAGTP